MMKKMNLMWMMVVSLVLSAVLVLVGCSLEGYEVSGQIYDQGGRPVPGVQLKRSESSDELTTNKEGYFKIDHVHSPLVILTPERDGWEFNPASCEVSRKNNTAQFIGIGLITTEIIFADSNLDNKVRSTAGIPADKTIYWQDVDTLSRLDGNDAEIEDLTGIENLLFLEELHLNRNNISDITKLADLQRLQKLYLSSNSNIDDYSSLAQLLALTHLELKENAIQTIDFLEELINLEYLYLSGHDLDLTDEETIRILNLLKDRDVIIDIEW